MNINRENDPGLKCRARSHREGDARASVHRQANPWGQRVVWGEVRLGSASEQHGLGEAVVMENKPQVQVRQNPTEGHPTGKAWPPGWGWEGSLLTEVLRKGDWRWAFKSKQNLSTTA